MKNNFNLKDYLKIIIIIQILFKIKNRENNLIFISKLHFQT